MAESCATLRYLTDDTIQQIDAAIGEVVTRTGFGHVKLVIDRKKLKWIQPAPSLPTERPAGDATARPA
jgi:hypothetical protein